MTTVRPDWQMPSPPARCYAEAHCDLREWYLVWREKGGLERGAIPWPFVEHVADGRDFERLGFWVVT